MCKITHDKEKERFETLIEEHKGFVQYEVNENTFDILHTIVPPEIGGRGIASQLVSAAYAYADQMGYKKEATCSYADIWLRRHDAAYAKQQTKPLIKGKYASCTIKEKRPKQE